MADLRIDLAAEFKGKKAFTQATKATSALDKSVAKLGKQIGSVFAVTKIVQFGKASLKAFAEDEAAANRLATSVKNLGLAFAQPEIDRYISKLEDSAGIADDQLRPAFQALLTTTGSLTKAQELLGLAVEGSRGSTYDLTTVAQDLANAYVGNTKGLKKYNLGLTQATLKTLSFTDVQKKFQQQFSGANAAYLATYAGQMEVLSVAAGNAQERIGKGLVNALILAGGKDRDVQDVADAMASLSSYTANAIEGVGVLASKLTGLDDKLTGGILGRLFSKNFELGWIGQLNKLGQAVDRPTAGRRFMGGAQANLYDASAAAEKKFQDQQKKLAAAAAKAAKALTAEQKKQAALKKAGTIFDQEQIQILAALKGKISEEDRKRLELQFALLVGNEDEAKRLTYELAKAQGLGEQLARYLASLPDAKNPFASWEKYLDMLAEKARQIASLTINAPLGTAAAAAAGSSGSVATNVVTNVATIPTMAQGYAGAGTTAMNERQQYIELKITGDGDLTNTIAKNLMQQSLSSGNQTYVNRRTGGFE